MCPDVVLGPAEPGPAARVEVVAVGGEPFERDRGGVRIGGGERGRDPVRVGFPEVEGLTAPLSGDLVPARVRDRQVRDGVVEFLGERVAAGTHGGQQDRGFHGDLVGDRDLAERVAYRGVPGHAGGVRVSVAARLVLAADPADVLAVRGGEEAPADGVAGSDGVRVAHAASTSGFGIRAQMSASGSVARRIAVVALTGIVSPRTAAMSPVAVPVSRGSSRTWHSAGRHSFAGLRAVLGGERGGELRQGGRQHRREEFRAQFLIVVAGEIARQRRYVVSGGGEPYRADADTADVAVQDAGGTAADEADQRVLAVGFERDTVVEEAERARDEERGDVGEERVRVAAVSARDRLGRDRAAGRGGGGGQGRERDDRLAWPGHRGGPAHYRQAAQRAVRAEYRARRDLGEHLESAGAAPRHVPQQRGNHGAVVDGGRGDDAYRRRHLDVDRRFQVPSDSGDRCHGTQRHERAGRDRFGGEPEPGVPAEDVVSLPRVNGQPGVAARRRSCTSVPVAPRPR